MTTGILFLFLPQKLPNVGHITQYFIRVFFSSCPIRHKFHLVHFFSPTNYLITSTHGLTFSELRFFSPSIYFFQSRLSFLTWLAFSTRHQRFAYHLQSFFSFFQVLQSVRFLCKRKFVSFLLLKSIAFFLNMLQKFH